MPAERVTCDRCHELTLVEAGSPAQDRLQDMIDGLAEEFICETCLADVMEEACENDSNRTREEGNDEELYN